VARNDKPLRIKNFHSAFPPAHRDIKMPIPIHPVKSIPTSPVEVNEEGCSPHLIGLVVKLVANTVISVFVYVKLPQNLYY